jgi:hypothetical protein
LYHDHVVGIEQGKSILVLVERITKSGFYRTVIANHNLSPFFGDQHVMSVKHLALHRLHYREGSMLFY